MMVDRLFLHSSLSPSARLKGRVWAQRGLRTTQHRRASILFALSALSNSRETQHFNKISRLSRVEHSPSLKLIKNSEVDPYPLPTPPPPAPLSARSADRSPFASIHRTWDAKALAIGRTLLADQARQIESLQRALARAKRREKAQNAVVAKEKEAWQAEVKKLRNDIRAAGVWIVLSIGTATALATWRFWPGREAGTTEAMGKRLAARTRAVMPLPATIPAETGAAQQVAEPLATRLAEPAPIQLTAAPRLPTSSPSWWQKLFWKQP